MNISETDMKTLLDAQQGELDGVETYLWLAKLVSNEEDASVFKKLAADEGRHASVFKQYTWKALKPRKWQAIAASVGYCLLGKKVVYPVIAEFEYSAVPRYERLIEDYPEVESVKNDEERHGDTVGALLKNGQFNDKPLLPFIFATFVVLHFLKKRKKEHHE